MLSLPTRNSTTRMRVWRALKDAGCGVLRDGVYVLPADAARAAALAEMESEIRSAGGFAMTVGLQLKTSTQLDHVRKLFDRSTEYGALIRKVNALKTALPRLGHRKSQTAVGRLQRAFHSLAEMDFFPGHAKLQTAEAISDLERRCRQLFSKGEPHPSGKRLRRVSPSKYRNRVWASRKNPWVDRLASAWLIKRFIDREARFVWIDRPRDCPRGAVGFDFDGAEFTHAGSRVTYEVLLATFALDHDQALVSIGAAVHFLDVGGVPIADAKGLETMLIGIKEKARDDDALLSEAMRILDLFYSAYRQTKESQSVPSIT
ncbi:MAG: chromate resistance protein ChrB domain-containing protein [Burkholderiales bacterium]